MTNIIESNFYYTLLKQIILKRALFMPPFLVLASVFFLLVKYATCENVAAYYILMFCCGFCMGGPFNIISSAIAADLVNLMLFQKFLSFSRGKIRI